MYFDAEKGTITKAGGKRTVLLPLHGIGKASQHTKTAKKEHASNGKRAVLLPLHSTVKASKIKTPGDFREFNDKKRGAKAPHQIRLTRAD